MIVVMTVRGVWLLCCLQTLPSAWESLPGGEGEGVGTAQAADQGLGGTEQ